MPVIDLLSALPEWSWWIRFERVMPEKGCHREYEINIVQDISGEWAVARCWGRVGGFQQRKSTCSPSREDATKLASRIARRRLSRGYSVAASE